MDFYKRSFLAAFFLILLLLGNGQMVQAKDGDETETMLDEIEAYMNLDAVDQVLQSENLEAFSFTEAVASLIRGELPLNTETILEIVRNTLLGELDGQRQMALQILVIVLASAVCSNFVKVFDSGQIADISFYMMYLLISTLLMQSFLSISQIVERTCTVLQTFMKALLPCYLVTVVFCAGSVSALGFYEITVLGINLVGVLIVRVLLPLVHFYLLLLLLNQLAEEDYFSRSAALVETAVSWSIKSALGLVIGLQTVQLLVSPAVDDLKSSSLSRLVKAIPGLGNVFDSVAETVAASAVVLKNAVGAAGILALLAICAAPVLKLAVSILLFRLLCALIQPICDKRMVDGIESISGASVLLLRMLLAAVAVFVISLAMITAAVKGG
jgi:stage III sporulation protein AE